MLLDIFNETATATATATLSSPIIGLEEEEEMAAAADWLAIEVTTMEPSYSPSTSPSLSPTIPTVTNEAETTAERILPRVTAFISLLGVICVAIEAFGDLRAKQTTNRSRSRSRSRRHSSTQSQRHANQQRIAQIQLSYQVALFCYSVAFVLGSLPAPNDQNVWGAYGNQATCSTQAFLFQFGMYGSILWDATLSTTYYRMVKNSKNNNNSNPTNKPWKGILYAHYFIWPIVLALSIYPLTTDLYNFNYTTCWIHEYPNNCQETDECLRGEGATLWINMASLAAILHLIYSVLVMIGLYCSIRTLEKARHASQSVAGAASNSGGALTVTTGTTMHTTRTTYSRKIAIQGLFYASGMILTMLSTAVMVLLFNTIGYWSDGLSTFAITMTPLVGYLNFLIYMRNRKTEQCHTAYARLLRKLHGCLLDHDWSSWWCCHCHSHCCIASLQDESYTPPPGVVVQQKTQGKPRLGAVSQLTVSGLSPYNSRELDFDSDSDDSDDEDISDMPPLSDADLEADATENSSQALPPPHQQYNNNSHETSMSSSRQFQTWKSSEVSDFETWKSEVVEEDIVVVTAPPPQASKAVVNTTTRKSAPAVFQMWKSSQVSDFETWESEMIVEEEEDGGEVVVEVEDDDRPKERRATIATASTATTATTDFRTWKESEVSGFETWQSEIIQEEEEPEEEDDGDDDYAANVSNDDAASTDHASSDADSTDAVARDNLYQRNRRRNHHHNESLLGNMGSEDIDTDDDDDNRVISSSSSSMILDPSQRVDRWGERRSSAGSNATTSQQQQRQRRRQQQHHKKKKRRAGRRPNPTTTTTATLTTTDFGTGSRQSPLPPPHVGDVEACDYRHRPSKKIEARGEQRREEEIRRRSMPLPTTTPLPMAATTSFKTWKSQVSETWESEVESPQPVEEAPSRQQPKPAFTKASSVDFKTWKTSQASAGHTSDQAMERFAKQIWAIDDTGFRSPPAPPDLLKSSKRHMKLSPRCA